jgi:F-type H+-transporting ATPase subunit b
MSEQVASVGQAPAHEATEPTAFSLNPGGWVALAVIIVFILLIWKKVPSAIGRALDSKIALIRDQLAEAEALRKEAEALKAEYEAKAASADKDREALLERARRSPHRGSGPARIRPSG